MKPLDDAHSYCFRGSSKGAIPPCPWQANTNQEGCVTQHIHVTHFLCSAGELCNRFRAMVEADHAGVSARQHCPFIVQQLLPQ